MIALQKQLRLQVAFFLKTAGTPPRMQILVVEDDCRYQFVTYDSLLSTRSAVNAFPVWHPKTVLACKLPIRVPGGRDDC